MKKIILTMMLAVCMAILQAQPKIDVAKQMQLSAQQYKGMLKEFDDTLLFPQSVLPDGNYRRMKSEWWCSGFFAGSLWYLYEYTKDPLYKAGAEKWTMALAKEQYNTRTHDLGFMMYNSFGNGLRLTNNAAYKPILLTGAESLSTRFDPAIGLIKSWNEFKGYSYPVIIDNMMNLEYLFWASRVSGNKKYKDLSLIHADNTLKNHFRADNSSYHVLAYDPKGNVLKKLTAQGYADESAWARGQAWGLYGYIIMYRETRKKKYLEQATKIADFFINHPNLPKDKIPYWDFNAPDIPNDVRDASAAAITASALLELSGYVKKAKAKNYFSYAETALQSLSTSQYFAAEGNKFFLLKHSTGHKPAKSEIDV
ncbi:MAG: glycoside hydrolase family 88 protein, partial [Gloeobacteraceae cyanobacterium ES-bin-316]|nr:glycoside hydrolase family 88 protein [Ferruginibacter sp.]